MNYLKMNSNKMNYKKLNKEHIKLSSLLLNLDFSAYKSEFGIIYTLYSDKYNLIEAGFAENDKKFETESTKKGFILLEKKRGKEQDLHLLIETLNELGIKFSEARYYDYSNVLIRHLSILGWPIGNSLYKRRRISKEISYS